MANMIDIALTFKGKAEDLKRLRKDLCKINEIDMPKVSFSKGWLGRLYYLNEKCSAEELKSLHDSDSFLVSCRPIIGDELVIETVDKWRPQEAIYGYLAEEYNVECEYYYDEDELYG